MISINTSNLTSGAQRSLNTTQSSLNSSTQRIATGRRINSGADDAAGLAIVGRMMAELGGLDQASRNANDGVSLAQTAEGGLGQITDSLQRMRDLAVQSSNATLNDDDRAAIKSESDQLKSEIDRIADTTNFNGVKLLDGSFSSKVFQVGANATSSDHITADSIASAKTADIGAGSSGTSVADLDLSTASGAQTALSSIDDALQSVSNSRSSLGALQRRFTDSISNLESQSISTSASASRIQDADMAKEITHMAGDKIRHQAGLSVLAQGNADAKKTLGLLLGK